MSPVGLHSLFECWTMSNNWFDNDDIRYTDISSQFVLNNNQLIGLIINWINYLFGFIGVDTQTLLF